MMHDRGQSDSCVVPAKSPNNSCAVKAARDAEGMEGRRLAKGNEHENPMRFDTEPSNSMSETIALVREAVKREPDERFTSLFHHVYNIDHLCESYHALRRDAAPGVDGVTWEEYGQNLEEHLTELSGRLARGGYRAPPVRRVLIPKPDGGQRPLGIPALEDKIVQRLVAQLLSVVWEEEFHGFSYGFRPGRSAHNALDALTVGVEHKRVNWVLDADLRGFFETISHAELLRMIEHRIGDRRIYALIWKWLRAGVLDGTQWKAREAGTPQGGLVSPVLANIYLHHAFDTWAHQWRTHHAHGDVIIVRYADDFVVGFEHRDDAEQFRAALTEQLRQYALELNAEKTRLIEFGRHAAANRTARGERKPETFNFLGFTHICGRTRNGGFTVTRISMRTRMHAKLKAIRIELARRWHLRIPEQGKWLRMVVGGYFRYHGVPGRVKNLTQQVQRISVRVFAS